MNPVILIFAGLGLLAGVLIVIGVLSSRTRPSVVQERLGRYTELEVKMTTSSSAATGLFKTRESPIGKWLNELLRERTFFAKVQGNLNSADLKINVGEYFAITLMCAMGGAVLGAVVDVVPDCATHVEGVIVCFATRSYIGSVIVALIGAGLGLMAPNLYVGYRKGQRLKAFDNQLGDTLNLMVNALRSGYSVLQAMEAVSKELPSPMSVEFRRIVQEIQLGLPMEAALEHLLQRINSEDLDLVITAINVQREVGGNLAEILDTISHTIRERIRIKGEIAVLTSQGMATGWAITLMPFILMGVLYFVNRSYIMEFFTRQNNTPFPCGYSMLVVALIMIIVGGLFIKKIVSIEV